MEQSISLSPQSLTLSNDNMSNMSNMTPDPLLKMEDFSLPSSHTLSVTKPVKKRKSWGQELPQPKTTLPPRKRAKTDDEKEQRRIERIKRNRAAAHNSRERKRVEAENLSVANDRLLHELNVLRQKLNVREKQLMELMPGGIPDISTEDLGPMKYEYTTEHDPSAMPTPSSIYTIDPRASLSGSTPDESLDDMTMIKIESRPSSPMPTPETSPASACPLDMTQHSAVMLWDLQCLSSQRSNRSLQSTLQAWWWTRLFLYLMHMNIMNCYKSLLMTMWTHFPARMTRLSTTLPTFSTLTRRQQTTHFLTTHPSWSTLAHLSVATGQLPRGFSAQALKRGLVSEQSVVSRSSGRLIGIRDGNGKVQRFMSGMYGDGDGGHGRDGGDGGDGGSGRRRSEHVLLADPKSDSVLSK